MSNELAEGCCAEFANLGHRPGDDRRGGKPLVMKWDGSLMARIRPTA